MIGYAKLLLITLFVIWSQGVYGQQRTIRQEMELLHQKWGVSFLYDGNLKLDVPYRGPSVLYLTLDRALKLLLKDTNIEGKVNGKYILLRMRDKVEKGNKEDEYFVMKNLSEVKVIGSIHSPVLSAQTGKKTLTAADLDAEYSLLSSPDVIKMIQRFSGVSEGIELSSGMYVHGGNEDENLFIIDDMPLYQTNHSLGLFSAFNTDVIREVDFYKSGFPARYNGRLSSVMDVRTQDGDLNEYHGTYSIGLLDGRFQMEGPIVKGKTSFNFGLRRSWMDVVTTPLLALANKGSEDKVKLAYAFHDINGKITHVFSDRSKTHLSVYSGVDNYKVVDESQWAIEKSYTENHLNWGNLNTVLHWDYRVSDDWSAHFSGIYTHNRSSFRYVDEEKMRYDNDGFKVVDQVENSYKSTITDVGWKAGFDYRPNSHHKVCFGVNYFNHRFMPQRISKHFYYSSEEDTMRIAGGKVVGANEVSFFVEDEMNVSGLFNVNLGANVSLFKVDGKCFKYVDPRLAFKFQLNGQSSLKLSYTQMTQFVHRVTNTYLEMPTSYWVPTTKELKPSRANQLAIGYYAQMSPNCFWSVEGFYKYSNRLLQYGHWLGVAPPATNWNENIMVGSGQSYGVEVDGMYKKGKVSVEAAYTLSWSKRKFSELYDKWYFDKFDNRHRLNVTARYKASDKVQWYAAWTFHSGNRMTLPTQYVNLPVNSGEAGAIDYIYEQPNNVVLPVYHRLDVGVDFRRRTAKNNERIWNISIYNAYCRQNTMYVKIKQQEDGTFVAKSKGLIPVIPSFSYTYKF